MINRKARFISVEILKNRLMDMRDDLDMTYQEIGDSYDKPVSKAVIWKIINTDYEPQDEYNRKALGLEPLVTVPVSKVSKRGGYHHYTPAEKRARAIAALDQAIARARKAGIEMDEIRERVNV